MMAQKFFKSFLVSDLYTYFLHGNTLNMLDTVLYIISNTTLVIGDFDDFDFKSDVKSLHLYLTGLGFPIPIFDKASQNEFFVIYKNLNSRCDINDFKRLGFGFIFDNLRKISIINQTNDKNNNVCVFTDDYLKIEDFLLKNLKRTISFHFAHENCLQKLIDRDFNFDFFPKFRGLDPGSNYTKFLDIAYPFFNPTINKFLHYFGHHLNMVESKKYETALQTVLFDGVSKTNYDNMVLFLRMLEIAQRTEFSRNFFDMYLFAFDPNLRTTGVTDLKKIVLNFYDCPVLRDPKFYTVSYRSELIQIINKYNNIIFLFNNITIYKGLYIDQNAFSDFNRNMKKHIQNKKSDRFIEIQHKLNKNIKSDFILKRDLKIPKKLDLSKYDNIKNLFTQNAPTKKESIIKEKQKNKKFDSFLLNLAKKQKEAMSQEKQSSDKSEPSVSSDKDVNSSKPVNHFDDSKHQSNIKDRNLMVSKEIEDLISYQVIGDGFCGLYALYVILFDAGIKDIDLFQLYLKLIKIDNQRDWFLAYALKQLSTIYDINLIIYSKSSNRIEIGNPDDKFGRKYILCDGVHFTPLVSNFDTLNLTLPYDNFKQKIDELNKANDKKMAQPSNFMRFVISEEEDLNVKEIKEKDVEEIKEKENNEEPELLDWSEEIKLGRYAWEICNCGDKQISECNICETFYCSICDSFFFYNEEYCEHLKILSDNKDDKFVFKAPEKEETEHTAEQQSEDKDLDDEDYLEDTMEEMQDLQDEDYLLHNEDECICRTSFENDSFKIERLSGCYQYCIKQRVDEENFSCFMNMFSELSNTILVSKSNFYASEDSEFKAHFAKCVDSFFKMRHDLLFFCFLLCLETDFNFETDVKLSNYGALSDKTPDYIIEIEGILYIMEMQVSNDLKKTYYQKGRNETNSKYSLEIRQIKDLGRFKDVKYLVLHVNSIDYSNNFANALKTISKDTKENLEFVKTYLASCKKGLPRLNCNDDLGHLVIQNQKNIFSDFIKNNANEMLEEFKANGLSINKDLPKTVLSVYREALSSFNNSRNRLLDILLNRNSEGTVTFLFKNRRMYVVKDDNSNLYAKDAITYMQSDRLFTIFYNMFLVTGKNEDRTPVVDLAPVDFYEESFHKVTSNYGNEHNPKVCFDIMPLEKKHYNNSVSTTRYKMDSKVYKLNNESDDNKKMLHNHNINNDAIQKFKMTLDLENEKLDKTIEDNRYKSAYTMPFIDSEALIETKNHMTGKLNDEVYRNVLLKSCDSSFVQLLKTWGNPDVISEPVKKPLPYHLQEDMNDIKHKYRSFLLEKSNNPDQKSPEYFDIKKQELNDIQRNVMRRVSKWQIEHGNKRSANSVITVRDITTLNLITQNNWRDKTKNSITRGVDNTYVNECKSFFEESLDFLSQKTTEKKIKHLDNITNTGADDIGMGKLKDVLMMDHKKSFEFYKSLKLCYNAEFVATFCYNLLYLSQTSYRSNCFQFANLGYDNTLLVVRGGASLHKNKTSRMFRLFYPVPRFFKTRENVIGDSYEIITINRKTYLITPWSILNENVLTENIFFNYKSLTLFTNYYTRQKLENAENCRTIMLPMLLAFNNRRSTESNLANIRYPIVNILGELNNLPKLAPDMAYIAKDAIQLYLRNSFSENYLTFASECKKFLDNKMTGDLTHPFLHKDKISCKTDFIYTIYLTYSMTKAPYNQQIEQNINMQGVMKIQEDYDLMMGMSDNLTDVIKNLEKIKDSKEAYDNEFYFDPEYCFELGKYTSNYFKTRKLLPHLHSSWNKIINEPWTDIITESGMRSDSLTKGKDSFFGRKGYEVVMAELMKDNEKDDEVYRKLNEIRDMDIHYTKKCNLINSMNVTFADKLNTYEEYQLFFHEVDKVQWKGSRQIYVMSLKTKLLQQPLEKFFSVMCKCVDNEIISIPSSKRLGKIHTELFPTHQILQSCETYYFTLDCAKWGPKSMFYKYTYMILGMSDILPNDFITLMLFCTKLYYKKYVVVSKGAWNIFSKNKRNEKYMKYYEQVEELESAKFQMPHSFVMGIFNYLSSLMHAINQKKATNEVTKFITRKYGLESIFHMNSHSDDSGGKLQIEKPGSFNYSMDDIMRKCMQIYENNLRSANHILSDKKCSVSKRYFELLSILYIDKQLLPMTPKFFSNIALKPTMNGFASDMSIGYGKCIEMISMGGVFSEAFFNMRAHSSMVCRFYHIDESDKKPVASFGGLFSHPLLVTLTGSLSDNIRLSKYDYNTWIKHMATVDILSGKQFDLIKNQGFTPKFKVYTRPSVKFITQDIERVYKEWVDVEILKNVKPHNTALYPIYYNEMLKNSDFLASLSYTGNTRRMARLMSTASAPCLPTEIGIHSVKNLSILIDLAVAESNAEFDTDVYKLIESKIHESKSRIESIMSTMIGEGRSIYDYISGNLKETLQIQHSMYTCKPTRINLDLKNQSYEIKNNPEYMFYSQDPMFYLLGYNKDLRDEKEKTEALIKNYLKNDKIEFDFKNFTYFTRQITKLNSVDIYIYSYNSTKHRNVKNYVDLMYMVQENSLYSKQLVKIFDDYKLSNIKNSFNHLLSTSQMHTVMNFKLIYLLRNLLKNDEDDQKLIYYKKTNKSLYETARIQDEIKLDESVSYLATDRLLSKLAKSVDSELILFEKETFCKFAFHWQVEQKKRGSEWYGDGVLLFNISNIILKLSVTFGDVSEIGIFGDKDYLSDSDIELMLSVCRYLKLSPRAKRNDDKSDFEYCLGMIDVNDFPKIMTKKEANYLYCDITLSFTDFNFPTGTVSTTKNVGVYNVSGFKVETILSLIPITMNDLNANFYTDSNDIKDVIIKNMLKSTDDLNTLDRKMLLDNFESTEFYKCFIYHDLYNNNYNTKRCIRNYCKKNDLRYQPLEKLALSQLIEYQVDPNTLPDEVVDKFLEKLVLNEDDFDMNLFIQDMVKYAQQEKDWDSFFPKWVQGKSKQAIVVSRKVLSEILEDPVNFCKSFLAYSNKMFEHFCEVLSLMFSKCYAIFDKSKKNFRTNTPELLTKDLGQALLEIKLGSGRSIKTRFVYDIFKGIFNNDYALSVFTEKIEENEILAQVPIHKDNYKKWAKLFLVSSVDGETDVCTKTDEEVLQFAQKGLRVKFENFSNLLLFPKLMEMDFFYNSRNKKDRRVEVKLGKCFFEPNIVNNYSKYYPHYLHKTMFDIENSDRKEEILDELEYEDHTSYEDTINTLKIEFKPKPRAKMTKENGVNMIRIPTETRYGKWEIGCYTSTILVASNSLPDDLELFKYYDYVRVYMNKLDKSTTKSYLFHIHPPIDFDLTKCGFRKLDIKSLELIDNDYDPLHFLETSDKMINLYSMKNIFQDSNLRAKIIRNEVIDTPEEDYFKNPTSDRLVDLFRYFIKENLLPSQKLFNHVEEEYSINFRSLIYMSGEVPENILVFIFKQGLKKHFTLEKIINDSLRTLKFNVNTRAIADRSQILNFETYDFKEYKPIDNSTIINRECEAMLGNLTNSILNDSIVLTASSQDKWSSLFSAIKERMDFDDDTSKFFAFADMMDTIITTAKISEVKNDHVINCENSFDDIYEFFYANVPLKPIKKQIRRTLLEPKPSLHYSGALKKD
uniref:RNA-dependent RNA polymerase n=1 Tax=Hymenoscyphus fraxineus negative stranded RNA virus 1 TaxID=2963341 RepID=A0A976RY62_9VIRU|nr:RNA-dependent RNA polymerase [Hymenoscyphus fraxineus negative stranded RNA virus 1]